MHGQKTTTQHDRTGQQLSDSELEMVAGGLNPQPLPPCPAPKLSWRGLAPVFASAAVAAVGAAGAVLG